MGYAKKTYSIDKVKRKKTRLTVDSVFVLLGFVDVRCQFVFAQLTMKREIC